MIGAPAKAGAAGESSPTRLRKPIAAPAFAGATLYRLHQTAPICDEPFMRALRRVEARLSLSTMVNAPPPFVPGAFVGTEHQFRARVYFEDTDLSGIVYHANYLRYMERARSDMLRLAGIDQRAAMEGGEGAWAVTDLAIKYRSPAKLDDDLLVVSTVQAVRGASVVIAQRILRTNDTLSGETLTDGQVTAAFLSPAGRPRRQPADWVQRFTAIMNGETIPC